MNTAIAVYNLSYRYPDGVEALMDVTFHVSHGECLGLIGPNGAGKSTLLLHLNGLLPENPPDHGSVSVGGRVVTPQHLAEVRRQVAFLFQDPNDQLFCPSVFEDVAFGPRQLGLSEAVVRAKVAQSLAKTGLTGFDSRLPHHLSLGERKRVCLAGLLACDPEVLILDEPSSGLDPRGRRELKTLLLQLPITKIMATHDLELVVELCPRVVILNKGRIVANGPTIKLLSDEVLMLENGLERPHILRHHHPHQAEELARRAGQTP